jgi:hypothetical protein
MTPNGLPAPPSRWTRGDVGREIGAWILAEVTGGLRLAGVAGHAIDAGHLVGIAPAAITPINLRRVSIVFQFGDGVNTIDTAEREQWLEVNFDGTIEGWSLAGNAAGTLVVDVWKRPLATYPPTVADTITASTPPSLGGAITAQSSTLTGWTTAVARGDVLKTHINSAGIVKAATLTLRVVKT